MKRIRRYFILLLLLAAVCLYGLTLYPHSPVKSSGASLEAPSAIHFLGTDNLGIDIFAQLSKGFYLSMMTGVTASACSFAAGGLFGVCAGFCGKRTDAVLSFITNVFLSVPQLPVMIVIGAFWGQSIWNIILLGIHCKTGARQGDVRKEQEIRGAGKELRRQSVVYCEKAYAG